MMQKNKFNTSLLIFLLAVLTLLFFKNVLFLNGDYIIQGSDLVQTYYQRFLYKAALLNGKLPLWNPHLYSGYPFLAHPYNGTFYPPNLLFLVMPINVAYSWIFALHVFLAGIFMFLLVKYLVKDNWAAFLSATAFMFSGFTATKIWAGHYELFATSVWIPLVFLLFFKALERKSFLWSIFAGLALAIQFFGGHNQTSFFTVQILLLYALFICYEHWVNKFKNGIPSRVAIKKYGAFYSSITPLFFFALVLFSFFIFSAVQSFPSLELVKLSTRGAGVPFVMSAFGSLWPEYILKFLNPNLFGGILQGIPKPGQAIEKEWLPYWDTIYYIGIIPLIMAFYGIFKCLNQRIRRFLSLIALFVLAVSGLTRVSFLQLWEVKTDPAGSSSILVSLVQFFEEIYYGKISMWRVIPLFLICFLLVSLIFWHTKKRFIDRVKDAPASDRMVLFFALLSIIGWILALGHYSGGLYYFLYKFVPGYSSFKWPIRHLIISNFALCVLAGYGISRLPKKYYLKIALILLILADLFWYGQRYLYLRNLEVLFPPQGIVKRLENDRGIFRILTLPVVIPGCAVEPSCVEYQYNAGIPFQIFNITGNDPMRLSRYHRLTNNVLQNLTFDKYDDIIKNLSNLNLLKLLNVKYIFMKKDIGEYKLDTSHFEIVEETDNGYLLLFKEYLPRFMFVENAVVAADDEDLINKVGSKSFVPDKEVVLEAWQSPIVSEGKAAAGDNHNVEVVNYTPENIDLAMNTPQPGYLVASEVYYPGWKAYINGNPTSIYRADYALRAVYIPTPGMHRVQFKFEPKSVEVGKWITVSGICFFALFLAGYGIKRRLAAK